jgi:hypothetical protein
VKKKGGKQDEKGEIKEKKLTKGKQKVKTKDERKINKNM